jgi:ribosome-binding ATPase YchF (GTP1/OBG family)
LLHRIETLLNRGELARGIYDSATEEEQRQIKNLGLLTAKPFLYVYNVSDLEDSLPEALVSKVHVKLDIKIEEELLDMSEAEAAELGMQSHVSSLIRGAYELLGLQSYFTTGPEETRSWTIKQGATAPEAGAAIHTDFQEKFIRAEVIAWDKLVAAGSWNAARDNGTLRLEGKDSVIQDGDVIVFKV